MRYKLIIENWRKFLTEQEQEGDPSFDRHPPDEEPDEEPSNPEDMSGDPAYELAAFTGQFRLEGFGKFDLEIFKRVGFEIIDLAAMFADITGQYMGTDYETGKLKDSAWTEYKKVYNDWITTPENAPFLTRLGKATAVVTAGFAMVPIIGTLGQVSTKLSKKIKNLSSAITRASNNKVAPKATQEFQKNISQVLTKLKFSEALSSPAFVERLSKRLNPEKYDYYIHIVTSGRSSGMRSPFTGEEVGRLAADRQKSIQDTGFLVGRYTNAMKRSKATGKMVPARTIRPSFGRLRGETSDEISKVILSATTYAPKKGDFVVNILQMPKGKKPTQFRKPLPADAPGMEPMRMRRSAFDRPEPIEFDTYIPWSDANVVAVIDGTGTNLKLLDKVQ